MRLFTALDISADCRAALVELVRELSEDAPFQWSRPENLHITTKFLGEWADLDALRRALAGVERVGPLPVTVRGVGWFPNPHSPRVLFAGIEAGPELAELHRRTDAACMRIGIAAEKKPFNPHLTLARIRTPDGLAAARQRIAQRVSVDFGSFTARAFHLYESIARDGRSEYKKLEEFSLL